MSLFVNIKKKLKGFSLEVSFETNGDYLGILGASGSGKSMTLKCIAGIETPDEGRIILNGKVLFDSEKKINLKPQERNIGYLFQNYALFPNMTVEENIGVGLKESKKEKEIKVKEIIKSFYLEGLEKKYPSKLSGGQQQRVAIARCIIYKPDILMLDEPFSALDSYLKEQLQSEVLEFLKLYNGEVLMVTHSRDEVYKFCENIAIIDKGNSILFGNTKDIFEKPKLKEAAILTGCKNISKCEVISSNKIYATEWGIKLETEKVVPRNINHVGIRAHNFEILDNGNINNEKNIIECEINKIVENVFEYNIMFVNKNSSEKNDSSVMVYKVKKEEWDNRKNKSNLYLRIPEHSILFLE
ncbi:MULTISPECIES: ATP-binding cassette domain-containing protein [unclassified Clostridium]|uniref:sulfate/molybdate ABC transporter ATP-binding protein n=1 Tax=unclassified Clostridium TaxID=2614128 RepID=UPI00189BD061|nr:MULTISPECIES: ATP-binding cassette domain-containing protein [unclassified Clostridium]MCR1951157.1 ATP-binding cassette domain-containing protein [Clostridium sp. DSM 100503]